MKYGLCIAVRNSDLSEILTDRIYELMDVLRCSIFSYIAEPGLGGIESRIAIIKQFIRDIEQENT